MENGNGELRQLLEIKRSYRRDLTTLEEEVKAKYERELADGKKRLKDQYLESIVDTIFAESAPAETREPQPAPEPEPAKPAAPKTTCPECDALVGPQDKFCSQCAAPLKEDLAEETSHEQGTNEQTVVSAGRKFSVRVR